MPACLVMRKIVRSVTRSCEWEQPKSQVVEVAANRTAMQLVDELLPRQALQEVSFKSILRFRSQTREMRGSFVSELERRLATISIETSLSEISAQQTTPSESLRKEIRDYLGSLQSARDKVWPGLVRGTTTAMAGGTLGAVALQLLAGGPYGVLAGSIVGASLGVLQTALDQRAEVRKAEVRSSPSVAYLSRV